MFTGDKNSCESAASADAPAPPVLSLVRAMSDPQGHPLCRFWFWPLAGRVRSTLHGLLAAMLASLICIAFSTATEANGRAWLGIWMGAGAGQMSGLELKQIVSIATVERGGPAEAAGLLVLDVILEIDDEPVHSRRAVLCLIKAARPGQTIRFVIQRQLAARSILVTLAEWPEVGMAPSNLNCPTPEISFKGEGGRVRSGRQYHTSVSAALWAPGRGPTVSEQALVLPTAGEAASRMSNCGLSG